MDPIFTIIISALATVIAAVIVISYVCYALAFKRQKSGKNDFFDFEENGALVPYKEDIRTGSENLANHPHERVYTTSHDGLKLSAEFYPVPGADLTEIQFHGYRSSAKSDFACGGYEAIRKNHNLLLVDHRAHGESEGKTISFGVLERFDCLAWVDYLNQRLGTDVDIMLFGVSMGAATVLMASELKMPENVRLIVADCSYSSPEAIIRRVIRDMHLPPTLAFPFVRLGGKLFGGFDISSVSPVSAVAKATVPTLIIHGEADSFVPVEMSREIYASLASDQRQIALFPGADHGISFLVDKERYLDTVKKFTAEAQQRKYTKTE